MQPGPDALRLLASGLVQSGEPLRAIKCLEAICRSPSLKPADNACARLQLAGLLMEYTRSLEQAVLHLNHAVSSQSMLRCDESHDSGHLASCLGHGQLPRQHSLHKQLLEVACLLSSSHEQVTMTPCVQVVLLSATPYMYCLKCEVLARLATCSRYLNDTKTQRTAHEKGLLTCEAGQQTAERCVQACPRAPVPLLGVVHRRNLQPSNGIPATTQMRWPPGGVGACRTVLVSHAQCSCATLKKLSACKLCKAPDWCLVGAASHGGLWRSRGVCLLLCPCRSTLLSIPVTTLWECLQ